MPYLTNTPLTEAVEHYTRAIETLQRPDRIETVAVKSALGRISAHAVYSRRSVPHYLACAMDGLAVKAADTFGATETTPILLHPGQFTWVDTGDVLPSGCDAVIMTEDVIWQEECVVCWQAAAPWQNIRQIGEDFCAGDMLIPQRTEITPAIIGVLLAGGVSLIDVFCPASIAIIPTGDEIVPAGQEPRPGEITEFNASVIAALLQQAGAAAQVQPIVPDQKDQLTSAVVQALTCHDWVLVLAGSSAGREDYTADILADLGQIIIHGLGIRPGKPAILAICAGKPVIGLPGYPVSGMIVMEKVVLPLLCRFAHTKKAARPTIQARLSRRLVSSLKYEEFVRVRLAAMPDGLTAMPLSRGAGLLHSFTRADGLLSISQNEEGLEAGSHVQVTLLRDQTAIEQTLCITGSHDPLLDELADLFAADRATGWSLQSAHVGSMAGLLAVLGNETHLAGIHLLDPASGCYNFATVRDFDSNGSLVLIEGFRRMQGLVTARGNPLHLAGLSDIIRGECRYVNRQKGSGTRVLLDDQLVRLSLRAEQINGYQREEMTHSGVAAQIASGSADCGLAIQAAARLFDLHFIPVAEECYDFVLHRSMLDHPVLLRFIGMLQSGEFARRVQHIGGYRLVKPGQLLVDRHE